ncbi:hypothetical protein PV328_010411 [Microctonus aethiopoides]|uniref:BTB domain-containing protein n=1 Tax=Microctonus aethiopoides TaxID=144406 RepID=A0AA39FHN3_9HYME|nr:hypothetical protein PV328_010411 [Microctonus aethiopoides]
MSQEDIEIKYKWQMKIYQNTLGRPGTYGNKATYFAFFENKSIPAVTFEIFCCIPSFEICNVIVSKTPHAPVSATITIKFMNKELKKIHVNPWTDNCLVKTNIEHHLRQLLQSNECEVTFECIIAWRAFKKPKPQVLSSSFNRFKKFLSSTDLSDMVIVIDQKEIPVHKIILAAYSPVFLAMFKSDMTESVNKRIVVKDIGVDIMEKVIEFMYTSKIDPIPEYNILLSILTVADIYQIMTLKEFCEEELSERMIIHNVLEILETASQCGVPQLIETLISFMIRNKSQIVALEDFKDFYHRKPELLFEFFIRTFNN